MQHADDSMYQLSVPHTSLMHRPTKQLVEFAARSLLLWPSSPLHNNPSSQCPMHDPPDAPHKAPEQGLCSAPMAMLAAHTPCIRVAGHLLLWPFLASLAATPAAQCPMHALPAATPAAPCPMHPIQLQPATQRSRLHELPLQLLSSRPPHKYCTAGQAC